MSDTNRLQREIARRRTFAIISHPDAGKTTLTEKLLLLGGAIHLAGEVKAKRGRANAVSDWMEMEKERGISITTSVMQFPYDGLQLNLLDTPGHADFSEDTYRTLHAVDGAVMLLDVAKGVEAQTRKLFRVCKRRAMPIFTLVNKMDRPGREPFELAGEVEDVLGIGVYPVVWPVYRSGVCVGLCHRSDRHLELFDAHGQPVLLEGGSVPQLGRDNSWAEEYLGTEGYNELLEALELLDEAGDAFDPDRFVRGELSPMFFGSAMHDFGLKPFLSSFCKMMPPPVSRETSDGPVDPQSEAFSGFIFKIQANMNRAHRDRIAFIRICSGRFERGMKVHHVRTDRDLRLANPANFVAQGRNLIEEAFAGDVIGVYEPGLFEIGDTITAGENFTYHGIPSFAPELFSRLISIDPLKRKQLTKGLEQLAQEGTIQLYRAPKGRAGDMILGAVGPLQIEVVKQRLASEYGADVRIESVALQLARWVVDADGNPVPSAELTNPRAGTLVEDVRGRAVMLFEGTWALDSLKRQFPDLQFNEVAHGVVTRE